MPPTHVCVLTVMLLGTPTEIVWKFAQLLLMHPEQRKLEIMPLCSVSQLCLIYPNTTIIPLPSLPAPCLGFLVSECLKNYNLKVLGHTGKYKKLRYLPSMADLVQSPKSYMAPWNSPGVNPEQRALSTTRCGLKTKPHKKKVFKVYIARQYFWNEIISL